VLSLTSGFGGAADPLAGQVIVLMKDSFENILRKIGVQVPAGTSPVHAWQAECQKGPAECKQKLSAMAAYTVTSVKLDGNGKATFTGVAAGTYYLFGSIRNNNLALLWDLQVDLKPGANPVTLDQRNATPIN